MWFGTEDGLNRFDGYNFITYRHNSSLPFGEGLPNDCIYDLLEDSTGKIWVCTNGGTCYYDYESNAFYPLEYIPGELVDEVYRKVCEDNQKNLWFMSSDKLVRYSPANKEFRIYPATEYFYPHAMSVLENGTPIFANQTQLFIYRKETERFVPFSVLTEEEIEDKTHITSLDVLPDVGIFVGTSKAGLKLFYTQSQQVETLIPEIYVRAVEGYNNNTFWVASETGLYIYNLIDKSVNRLTKIFTNEFTLSDNAIYNITRDSEGGMWVGTFFGGINYLPQQYTPFEYYIAGKTHKDMLGNAVREIVPDKQGYLWLGTEDNGINRYNPTTREMINFSANHPVNKISAINIQGLMVDGDKLWIGSLNRGIDILDINTGKVIKQYSQSSTNQKLFSDHVVCFYKTSAGEILIGTSAGLLIYKEESDSFAPWQYIRTHVRQIMEDSKGTIWVATRTGVYRYLPDDDRLNHYQPSDKRLSLGSNSITSVFEDSKGQIWVTTMYGFSLYNEETDSFNRITTENGLPSNIVYRIVEDDDGDFWITTANGLVKFNPETNIMHVFSSAEGLHETQFNYNSSYKAPNGTIYFGTINGMLSFSPRLFQTDSYSPPVYITNVSLPNEQMQNYELGQLSGETPFTLKLPYHSSSFTISYTALNYTSPHAVHYTYMLEGLDKDWLDIGYKREVNFAYLSPGEYVFRVKSTNSSEVWQENERTLSIIITPPFWWSTWAILFYVLLLMAFIYWLYNLKKRQFERKHLRAQEIYENEKEKEIYNAKIQFFTFITHEIRTPLTLIKAPLEKAIRLSKDYAPVLHNLEIIEKNTLRLLNLSNQLLDFRKTESRGFKLNFVRTDVWSLTDSIIQTFLPMFEREGKSFHILYPNKQLYASIDREAFSKIVSNLISNAFKYSQKTVTLQATIDEERDTLQIIITNDGALIPLSEKEEIFKPFYRMKENENTEGSGIGLSLSRTLAEFHSGTLNYQHTNEHLNQFILEVPTKQKDHYLVNTPDDETPTEAKEATVPSPTLKQAILVVEDQKDMRQFIVEDLKEKYHVLEAENGEEALTVLENNSINLIISDIMMPVMDGFELCNKVKNNVHYSHIPFIILTAQHNLQSRLEGLNKGADAYMEKPFSMELLQAQVVNLLKSREMLSKAYLEKPLMPTQTLAVSPLDDIFLNKFNVYLDKNLTSDTMSVESLAAEMGMSTSSLYRKVKGLSGLSPNDFIRVSRLKKAVQLIQAGETRINDIAFRVGFSSPTYFSTCFQKQYGKTPTEFIRELGSE
ncbi:ligand-binding sensor domain-containing protein/signal transduction histidine kinase/DNA-binding response OmpR family regulator [Parabacteroides sp. PF5-6]|nr:ligand-binding sensor domain-containing protein/signal transduction histidine kinase/DNA-binding response OmpR family regulator [Parabacteroides sp. PF5-6]